MNRLLMSFSILFTCFFSQCTFSQFRHDELTNHALIAIGEASHGEKTIYQYRFQCVKEILTIKSNIDIAIEMPASSGFALNDYQQQKINRDSVLKSVLYFGLQTDSFLEFLDSCKQFGNRIHYYGVDLQNPKSSFLLLKKRTNLPGNFPYLNKISDSLISTNKDPELEEKINREFCDLKFQVNALLTHENTENQLLLQTIEQGIHFYFLFYENQNKKTTTKTQELTSYNNDHLFRDSCMAANLIFCKKQSERQMLFFGANYHLIRKPGTCGNYVANYYKNQYFIIAQQFVGGSCLTVEFDQNNKRSITTKEIPLFKKGLPIKLKQMNVSGICVIRDQNSPKLEKIWTHRCLFLDLGGRIHSKAAANYYTLIPEQSFDAVFFHLNAVPSVYSPIGK